MVVPPPPTRRRLLAALAGYIFSAGNLIMVVQFTFDMTDHPEPAGVAVVALWYFAWGLLTALTAAWVLDIRWPRRVAAGALLVGVASLLAMPLTITLVPPRHAGLGLAVAVLVVEVLLTLPALLLAERVLRFHWHGHRHRHAPAPPRPAAP